MQRATLNNKPEFLCEVIQWQCTVGSDCKRLVKMYLCLGTRLSCKVISELIAFSRQVYQPEDEGSACKKVLALL